MKCYKHTDREARGVCAHCGKALCEVCAAEISKRLFCGSCAETNRNTHKSMLRVLAVFAITWLAAFSYFSVAYFQNGSYIWGVACAVFSLFMAVGIGIFFRAYKSAGEE